MSAVITLSDLAPDHGKRLLIEAALRLAARSGNGLSSLGLRELAREADLNANTFYRHFDSLEELGEIAVQEIAARIMAGMAEVRRKAARHADATLGAVQHFLDFVREHPQAFIVGLRELHSMHSPLRPHLLKVLDGIAEESVQQIEALDLVPGVERAALKQAAAAITYQMFCRALDVLEQPQRRKAITAELVWLIRTVFLGAASSGR